MRRISEQRQALAVTTHYLTFDVEEYFQVSAFEHAVPRSSWNGFESRLGIGVDRVMALLQEHATRATFFILGWVAARHPVLVRRIAAAGHEIASHGWGHERVTALSREAFRDSVRRSKASLEQLTGCEVLGYRAPSFSIVPGLEWTIDVLLEEGYRYDSSLFPIRRPGYGYPGGGRDPYWLSRPGGRLLEFPPATLRVLGWNLPAAGGAYLRILPLALTRRALRQASARGEPATLYLHPWELDPQQPRLAVSAATRFRHYTGLSRTLPRLERLLREFRFSSISTGLRTAPAPATA